MKGKIQNLITISFSILLLIISGCTKKSENVKDVPEIVDDVKNTSDTHTINFNGNVATLDGKKINEYNYIWHIDPKGDYSEVKDSPAEYYSGDKPDESEGIWIAHDIKYFPIIDKSKFYKAEKGNDPEWNINYENEKYNNLIFASLPRSYEGNMFPDYMMHSEEEAYKNPCIHITKPGTYVLTGTWNGQIFVDLGKNSATDPEKKINLLLDNLEVNCTVAPAINIYRTYECDNAWEDRKEDTCDIDLKNAGANIIIKDNTKNYVSGANVYRIYKNVLKKSGKEQKIAIKYDVAIQSDTTFRINGEKLNNGELYVNSTLEGISSNLHLEINGGKTYINADNDAINCSEDNVSIIKINDGTIMINAGLSYQGDGIDSNGYIVINGGDIVAVAKYEQDPGIDAPKGVYINGGNLVVLGEKKTVDWPDIYMGENTNQSYVFKSFEDVQPKDTRLAVIDENGKEIYEFCENDIYHIKDKARPFRGVLISNPNIKKDASYDVIAKR